MKNLSFALLSTFLLGSLAAETVTSPSGELALEFSTASGLEYRVEGIGRELVSNSEIRVQLADDVVLGTQVEVVKVTRSSGDSTWNPVVPGRRAEIRDHYNEVVLECVEGGSRKFSLVARAYDDGVAFKYVIPMPQGQKQQALLEEVTQFNFSGDPTYWAGDHESFVSNQESHYLERNGETPIGDTEAFFGSPVVVRLEEDAKYVVITEGRLVDFSGMFLEPYSNDDYAVSLQSKLSRFKTSKVSVSSKQAIESSWRVLMVAEQLPELYANDIILNLSDPCELEDTSWIQPGIAAWDNWWSGGVRMNTATIKKYIDLAAYMGWDYQLIDWQWYGPFKKKDADITTVNKAVDMDAVRRYAEEKGVKLWLWAHWTDVDRNDAYIEAFKLYESWGIAGVKIDFMMRDDQWMVNWCHKIVKKAAEHKLMVNFHGAYKPTGWRRTYPNLMTREGVYAMEHSRTKTDVTPDHNCTIIFTRNLLGEVDYTPGGFRNRTPELFKVKDLKAGTNVLGTRAHQLAMFVIYESPIATAADRPSNYYGATGSEFLKRVPTVWDETLCTGGAMGEYGILAKRSGDDWFLGVICDSNGRELDLDLSFLGEGRYQATIWRDGDNANVDAEDCIEETREIAADERSWKVTLAQGGGVAIHFEKLTD